MASRVKGAPKGNKYWMARSSHGPNPEFKNSAQLWAAAVEYFEWVEKNPLYEAELVKFKGSYKTAKLKKSRAMSIKGLMIFLGLSRTTWYNYASRDEFKEVCERIDDIIETQNIELASADLLNPQFVARRLGLTDKKELTGANGEKLMPESITFVPYEGETESDGGDKS